jgi:hypothetical protein
VDDLEQPCAKRALGAEARQAVERAQKRVLGNVLSFIWAGYACSDPIGDAFVALYQRLERHKVTGKRPFNEGSVRIVHGA